MGFAAVARVTDERWVTCSAKDDIGFGLKPGDELPVGTTICKEIRDYGQPLVIEDVSRDEIYRDHATPALYGFRSYISFPIIRADGSFFGTLCAIDPKPIGLRNPATLGMFKLFAELIAHQLDDAERLARSEAALSDSREISELREQFIAVLGHDLRNPLASISAGAAKLAKNGLGEKPSAIVKLMQGSVARMSNLIDNLMDFARGRLGDGMNLVRACRPLRPSLEQVVNEMQTAAEDRIETDFQLEGPIVCDHARIEQLVSNLIGNAIVHGAPNSPIRVEAGTRDGRLEITVANRGNPIPAHVIPKLFQPFARGSGDKAKTEGLGLGLFIASEIARAHGGEITVRSDAAETRFTFAMPLA